MAKFIDPEIQAHLLKGGKIKRKEFNCVIFLDEKGVLVHKAEWQNAPSVALDLRRIDLMEDDWIIVESRYNYKKIIQDKILCLFWNHPSEGYTIGFLEKNNLISYCPFSAEIITDEGKKYALFQNCKPFNPADFNIIENIKDYKL